ncbi:MAG: hypothetical protein U0270_03565 [Labilithrix sp.]
MSTAPGKKIGEKCADIAECAQGMCGAGTCMEWAGAFLGKAPGK